jgi:hypothetical protein
MDFIFHDIEFFQHRGSINVAGYNKLSRTADSPVFVSAQTENGLLLQRSINSTVACNRPSNVCREALKERGEIVEWYWVRSRRVLWGLWW